MRFLIALAACWLVSAASAIEAPKPAAPPASAPAKAEPEKDESAASAAPAEEKPEPEADDEELPPLPADAAPAGPPPARFNPTEKVRADFPVSFPIDI